MRLAASVGQRGNGHSFRSSDLAITRWDDTRVDALVLCDTTLATMSTDGQATLMHDDRLHLIDNPIRAAYLQAISTGAPFDRERPREMQAPTATGKAATSSPRPHPT